MKFVSKFFLAALVAAALIAMPLVAQADVVSAKASGAVVAKTFVKLSAAGTIATASAATDTVIGVCETSAAAGGLTSYAQPGMVVTVTSGEAVAIGQQVQTGTGGKAFVRLGSSGRSVGIALSVAAAADADLTISFSPQGGVTSGVINPYTMDATAKYAIGQRYVDETDGRVFRYAGCGTAGWQPGCGAFFCGSVIDLGSGAGENLHANAAIGDTTVVIEVASVTADAWAGGYIVFGHGSALGARTHNRRIVGNTASAATTNHVTVTLDGALTAAVTTSDYCELIINPYSNLQTTTSEFSSVGGVPCAIATTGQFGWVQTWGPCWITGNATPGSTAMERKLYFVGDGSIQGDVGLVAPTTEPERRQEAGFIIQKDSSGSGGPPFVMLQISP